MTMHEYQGLAQRTSPDNGHDRILNGTMGLIGEGGEVVDAVKKWVFQSADDTPFPKEKIVEEIGDVLWYVAELCTGADLQMEQLVGKQTYAGIDSPEEIAMNIVHYALRAHHSTVLGVERCLEGLLATCEYMLEMYCKSSLQDAMEKNIEKLSARYPDGFDPERSMHRDVTAG